MHIQILPKKTDKMFPSSTNSHSMFPDPPNDDMWKKFDLELVTPPLSPTHDGVSDLDLENMPFDLDTEDLMLFDDENIFETMKELTFPESPPDGFDPLIQDIMWSAPTAAKSAMTETDVTGETKKVGRNRCDSCSGPFKTACVAPEDVFPGVTQIGGTMSQTRITGLGIETPSDSEEEIDVVTVEKQYQVSVPSKRKQRSDEHQGTKTVTLTIEHKATSGSQTVHKKCNTPIIHQKVDCPTDVHNYSLPMTSLKRVRAFLSTSDSHHKSSKKLKRDNSVPSDLRKVAQKLKSSASVGSSGSGSCSSSRSSSDSEDFCDSGKRTQHNVLERKRRTDLKNSFFHLRDSVPELEGQERAPKVLILRKASQYIIKLIEDQRKNDREMELLKNKREKLKRHLSRLRDY